MNDMTISPPQDAAIEALRERVRLYDANIQDLTRRMEVATGCRDDLLEVIATLGRKSRPRKPRAVAEAAPGVPETTAPVEVKMSTRALFAVPVVGSEPEGEAA